MSPFRNCHHRSRPIIRPPPPRSVHSLGDSKCGCHRKRLPHSDSPSSLADDECRVHFREWVFRTTLQSKAVTSFPMYQYIRPAVSVSARCPTSGDSHPRVRADPVVDPDPGPHLVTLICRRWGPIYTICSPVSLSFGPVRVTHIPGSEPTRVWLIPIRAHTCPY
jgi:hypothetical protein